jgi:hypothetical protein
MGTLTLRLWQQRILRKFKETMKHPTFDEAIGRAIWLKRWK